MERAHLIVINLLDETVFVVVGPADESHRPIYTILHFDCNFARLRKPAAMHRHTCARARRTCVTLEPALVARHFIGSPLPLSSIVISATFLPEAFYVF